VHGSAPNMTAGLAGQSVINGADQNGSELPARMRDAD
jgi:hypothetical protein